MTRVLRLGLAQIGIGAVAALLTSTVNRVQVVELGLPALVPAALVALHFLVQLARVPVGHASDRSGRGRWMVVGGVALALGLVTMALGTALAASARVAGIAIAASGASLIGLGMSCTGTALLAEVGATVETSRLGRAAAVLWIMMVFGLAATAGTAGAALDPFDMRRLVVVCGVVALVALALVLAAATATTRTAAPAPRPPASLPLGAALRAALADGSVRRFALFVFAAMLAFSMQDLILEPFAGRVFAMSPGASTRLAGMQHGGVLAGLALAAWLSARVGTLRGWAVGGCLSSGAALAAIAMSSAVPVALGAVVLRAAVVALGVSNGAFAVGALGAMMSLTASGGSDRGGTAGGLRIGVFGAAQGLAYGLGGLLGGALSDVATRALGSAAEGYGAVFALESALFVVAAWLAARTTPSAASVSPRAAERAAHLALLR